METCPHYKPVQTTEQPKQFFSGEFTVDRVLKKLNEVQFSHPAVNIPRCWQKFLEAIDPAPVELRGIHRQPRSRRSPPRSKW